MWFSYGKEMRCNRAAHATNAKRKSSDFSLRSARGAWLGRVGDDGNLSDQGLLLRQKKCLWMLDFLLRMFIETI